MTPEVDLELLKAGAAEAPAEKVRIWAPHVDGGTELMLHGTEQREKIPEFLDDAREFAFASAALLKQADPECTVSVLLWTVDPEQQGAAVGLEGAQDALLSVESCCALLRAARELDEADA